MVEGEIGDETMNINTIIILGTVTVIAIMVIGTLALGLSMVESLPTNDVNSIIGAP